MICTLSILALTTAIWILGYRVHKLQSACIDGDGTDD